MKLWLSSEFPPAAADPNPTSRHFHLWEHHLCTWFFPLFQLSNPILAILWLPFLAFPQKSGTAAVAVGCAKKIMEVLLKLWGFSSKIPFWRSYFQAHLEYVWNGGKNILGVSWRMGFPRNWCSQVLVLIPFLQPHPIFYGNKLNFPSRSDV